MLWFGRFPSTHTFCLPSRVIPQKRSKSSLSNKHRVTDLPTKSAQKKFRRPILPFRDQSNSKNSSARNGASGGNCPKNRGLNAKKWLKKSNYLQICKTRDNPHCFAIPAPIGPLAAAVIAFRGPPARGRRRRPACSLPGPWHPAPVARPGQRGLLNTTSRTCRVRTHRRPTT